MAGRGRPKKPKKMVNRDFPQWMYRPIDPALQALPAREPHVLYDEPDEVELEQREKLRSYSRRKKEPTQ
jgi:hypothetical protein